MLFFGHIGITLGIGLAINQIIAYRQSRSSPENLTRSIEKEGPLPVRKLSLWGIGAMAIGSLLPDIIDKPIGHYLFDQTFGNNGRLFSHTLLLAVIILAIGLYLYLAKRWTWGLALTFGVFMHLILDYMWKMPSTLLWPFMGLSFPKYPDEGNYLANLYKGFFDNPGESISEIVGFCLFLGSVWILVRNRYFQALFNKKSL